MALESATTISGLVATNPVTSDPVSQGASHITLIKSVLKTTFPNYNASQNSSPTQVDAAVAAATGNGTISFAIGNAASPSINFSGDTGTGLYGSGNGALGVSISGSDVLAVNSTALSVNGNVVAEGLTLSGSTSFFVPIGGGMMWFTSTCPTGFGFANGQAVSRTTYATLFGLWGTTYGAGDGSTTFNLPSIAGRAIVGVDSAGTTTPSLASVGAKTGAATHTLTTAEIPKGLHTLNDPGHNHGASGSLTLPQAGDFGATPNWIGGNDAAGSATEPVAVTVNGSDTNMSLTDNAGGGAHSIVQPSFAVNFAIRLI